MPFLCQHKAPQATGNPQQAESFQSNTATKLPVAPYAGIKKGIIGYLKKSIMLSIIEA